MGLDQLPATFITLNSSLFFLLPLCLLFDIVFWNG